MEVHSQQLIRSSILPDLSASPNLLFRLGCCSQNLLDPLVLPPVQHNSLVPMGIGICMDPRGTLLYRQPSCCDIRM